MAITRRTLLTVIAALLGILAYVVVTSAPPARAAMVKIMPLGDSITGSPGCWRALLWNKLVQAGYTGLDFVGTLPPQGCSVPYDGDNEGHGGYLATNVADQDLLPGWLSATRPDIVMMHFGTNDVWSNRPTDVILAAYSKLVDQMRASNPSMRILVAQIIPMNPSSCPECAQRAVTLNAAIPGWARSKTTTQSPVVVVDQWTGFSTATDTYDGVHPNSTGDQKMADKWYPALAGLLGAPQPSPSPTPTPPPPGSGCSATYKIINSWQGGFGAEVTIRNTGTTTTTDWTVTWTYTAGQTVSQLWNGTATQSGTAVTVKNASYNGTLAAGASTTFGFNATWTATNPVPSPVTCAAS
ncbi:cellulose binding domain-containing protein [Sphaerisporangium fuscum]|uniref:cellulose binding domain-containing protein n=1 Tax=Sphaerisporangium fuscum TaxID=2835868 RepID=UPI001BDC5C8A|nr:cellulose binding domain-containing protein [Sphaerisporangium fuscum]